MGGVSQAVRTMVRSLVETGVDNEILSLDEPHSLQQEPGFMIHEMGPAKGFWAYNKKLGLWLNENISRFDVVIVHGLWLYYGYAVRKALEQSNRKNLKLLVMPHGMLDPYFQKARGRRIKAIRNSFYWSIIERHLINSADGLLFTCEEEKELAKTTFSMYKPKKELVIGLGVDQPPFYEITMKEAFYRKCPEIASKPYLLFLSRIHEKKGVDLSLKAFEKTYSPFVSTGSHTIPMLVIAGPGMDTEYGAYIRSLADQSIMSKFIVFPGMLTGPAKWGAFYHCEAFMLPSHQENFGIAIIEALACGKPVMISNKVNIWREIVKEKVGFVSTDDDDGAMKMMDFYQDLSAGDKIRLKTIATTAYQQNFSTSGTAEKLVNVISSFSISTQLEVAG